MAADGDGHWPGTAVTQDGVDLIERHAAHQGVIDLHNLITTPFKAPTGSRQRADQQGVWVVASLGSHSWLGCLMRPQTHIG